MKKNNCVRVYPDDKKLLIKWFGSVQGAIDDLVARVQELEKLQKKKK